MLKDIWRRIEKRLDATGLSAAAASAKAGLSKDAIRNIQRAVESGKQDGGTSTTTIAKLAPVLETTASWLLEGVEPTKATEIPLMGYIGAGAKIEPDFNTLPRGGLEQLLAPFPLPLGMIAFEIRGDAMLPAYKAGTVIICYGEQKRPLQEFYGEEAVVQTNDSSRSLKTITRGADGVNLMSLNAAMIENVQIEWIGEIFAILPKNSVQRPNR